MLTLHPAPTRGAIQSCQKVDGLLSALFDIEDAANGAPYSNMSFSQVMYNIAEIDAYTGEVTQAMLRDRAVLQLIKHKMINGLLRVV